MCPTKTKWLKSIGKRKTAIFPPKSYHMSGVPLEEVKTVIANCETDICLPEVIIKFLEKPTKSTTRIIILYHDNTSSHSSSKKF